MQSWWLGVTIFGILCIASFAYKPGVGRRSVSVDEQERWVFNRVATWYRSRPGYPNALIERLSNLARRAGGRVLDLGAGTGHLAIPLARRGHAVTAVEPARAMLAELSSDAERQQVRIAAVNASAERTGLPGGSFDLIAVADALQWMDPELAGREAARLLRPDGVLVVIEARLGDSPFMRELRQLLWKRNPKAKIGRPSTLTQFLSPVSRSDALRAEIFADEVGLDDRLLAAIIQSLTFAGPALGATKMKGLVEEAERLRCLQSGATWRRDLIMRWVLRSPRAETCAKSK